MAGRQGGGGGADGSEGRRTQRSMRRLGSATKGPAARTGETVQRVGEEGVARRLWVGEGGPARRPSAGVLPGVRPAVEALLLSSRHRTPPVASRSTPGPCCSPTARHSWVRAAARRAAAGHA
ncbi:hypothetical protein ACP70R_049285 [Stipagrostis hirtigluma subsp. patula]